MPELAEVEAVRQQIKKHLVGQKIQSVTVDYDDKYLFKLTPPKEVERALKGRMIKGVERRGKYLWIQLDQKPWLVLHLGMTGNIAILDPKANSKNQKIWEGAKLWSERNSELRDRLNFCHFLFESSKGVELALIDPRRFAKVWLSEDPENSKQIKRLGFDPLLNFPSAKVLGEKLAKRKKAIKSVLLDQNLFAGIGNWLADEILFQAKISPHHNASSLTPKQISALRTKTLSVVKKAVDVSADYERFPKTWLFHDRWGKKKNSQTHQGHKIIHEDIGGRTTAWCPDVQT